ncbi:ammonia monooxygenase [Diaphorobacter sp. HDW4B]|uniref:DUF6527 family protein n=1 Tax=Diaphorobacter sp. HDW4B TaxID=2714925 RepID=UPI00140B061C|nr:DUF6527 family protein [Diaphorobacter sp. HDW4B]QIL71679.1 ammonia monooxygenase [Diaphorobacter sp. HDW4B]
MKPVIKQNEELLRFHCPGCDAQHAIQHGAEDDPNWSWNGSLEKPTFSPSVLVTYTGADAGRDGAPPAVCHSFVTDGRIQFLGDCTHALAGQTVDLPEWIEWSPNSKS